VRARVNKGKRSSESVLHSVSPASIFWWDDEGIINVYINGVLMKPQEWPIWLLHDKVGRCGLECRKKS
jgi:hypothetical protein